MKELPFPEGVKPLDIFVSSVNKRRLTEEFEGRSGTLNYGYDYGERSVDLSLWLEAYDTIDYRLIRNELYAFFDTHDVFYIEETRVPSRVLKVTIDESYIPERINQTHSSVEISCRTLDSVFWESKYTTLELHDSGYSATAEKYGLVDNIDDEKVQYRFTPTKNRVSLSDNAYERGMIAAANGSNASNSSAIRLTGSIAVKKGFEYTFIDLGNNADVDRWWIIEYDSSGAFVGAMSTGASADRKSVTFVTKGNSIRFFAQAKTGTILELSDVGVNILPSMDVPEEATNFTVYNAGNVTIEPESMYLEIRLRYASFQGKITVKNKTTGDVFEFTNNQNRLHISLLGMNVLLGATNGFRYSNRRFISLAPGDNEFEISGGTFEEFWVDFKYMYK